MTTIGKLKKCSCEALQGLKYQAISYNTNSDNVITTINHIQHDLSSFDYNKTLKNNECFALKFNSLENPINSNLLETTIISFIPYKTYSNKIKMITKHKKQMKG